MNIIQKLKQKVWNLLYKVWPWAEHTFLSFHQKQRQKYHIGWLRSEKTLKDLKHHLSKKWGFGNHFVAWEDSSQILSWRKLESFDKQYHLRVYNDGEIRGHYEYTPESSAYKHFFGEEETKKEADFLKFLDGYIVHKKFKRHLELDIDPDESNSEITFLESENK